MPLAIGVAAVALHPRTRAQLWQRLGWHGAAVAPGAVWIHASSVGEVGAARALWEALEGPKLLTTDTAEGLAVARGFTRGACALLPVDHPFCLAPLWADARPRAVVFVEGTLWPGLARRARKAGVPVVRVSAKAGRGTRRVPPRLLRWLWRDVTAVGARDEGEAGFLRACHDAEVVVLGDLKLSLRPPASPLRWQRPFVAGASLRRGDARRLLAGCPEGHQLLLAPRHPTRFDQRELGTGRFVRRSELPSGEVPSHVDGVLLDTLGELGSCLQGAAAVFVGGTFDAQIGGHSPREAQAWGCPVVAGPHVHSAPTAFEGVEQVVDEGQLPAALQRAVERTNLSPPRSHVAQQLAAFVQRQAGPPAPESSPRPWALPLVPGYLAGAWLHQHRPRRVVTLDVPVISVGSTNARSPGRTSSVRFLVGALRARGHRVGVAVRGYRRQVRGRDVRCSWVSDSWRDLGDEGALLARCGALVAAGPDRAAAARALQQQGCTVVVLDDGLQSREVHRDVELVVVDARFPSARGPLPAGERRGVRSVPRGVDVVWVHHGDGRFATPGVPVERHPGVWRRGGEVVGAPSGPVRWFVGVGHPAAVLAAYDGDVEAVWVAGDHEAPPEAAFRRWVEGGVLVTTAKDATRLPPDLAGSAWVRDVDLHVPVLDWLPEVR